MKKKFISARKIHDGRQWMPEGTVLEIDKDGRILNIHKAGIIPKENIDYHDGVICPGFVNAHCHLELSHMKNKVEEGTGLIPFLQTISRSFNKYSDQEKQEALKDAIEQTKANGIVAVGDIANGTTTLDARIHAGFHIHTFVEALGFIPAAAKERFAFSERIYQAFAEKDRTAGDFILRQSIAPHSPYSNSSAMFALIDHFSPGSLLSIHNEESAAENDLFRYKSGEFLNFYKAFPLDISHFRPSGKSSLQTYLPWISVSHPLILVHNTFMDQEDINFLKENGRSVSICLCPNANWFIERRLPSIDLFDKSSLPICLGTDSLASNSALSILSEMHTIKKHFPEISWEKLLSWATWNGAVALQMEDYVGKIEKGKKPGLVRLFGDGCTDLELLAF